MLPSPRSRYTASRSNVLFLQGLPFREPGTWSVLFYPFIVAVSVLLFVLETLFQLFLLLVGELVLQGLFLLVVQLVPFLLRLV